MAAALVSMITGKTVKKRLGMTGELTLTGRVLAIGGVKEKALAALRAGGGYTQDPAAPNVEQFCWLPQSAHDDAFEPPADLLRAKPDVVKGTR